MSPAEVAGRWLGLICCHPKRPPAGQRDVLMHLAADERAGAEASAPADERVASVATLSAICEVSRSTVQRALRWARNADLLKCVLRARGRRLASRWRLVIA